MPVCEPIDHQCCRSKMKRFSLYQESRTKSFMGSAELDIHHRQLIIYSNIITYGNAANPEITKMIREEIETMWNEPQASLKFGSLSKGLLRRSLSLSLEFMPGIIP